MKYSRFLFLIDLYLLNSSFILMTISLDERDLFTFFYFVSDLVIFFLQFSTLLVKPWFYCFSCLNVLAEDYESFCCSNWQFLKFPSLIMQVK